MPDDTFAFGSVANFDESWRALEDKERYHFARGEPQHQVQYAFQNHFRVFQKVLGGVTSGRAIEVGCGRGSMAAFFADAGFETHLLDTSPAAIELARRNFAADELEGTFVVGDALNLPYEADSFDVTVSIGLLEHFEDISVPVAEQIRVLRPGGVFLGYVVPEHDWSVQSLAKPINGVLAAIAGRGPARPPQKAPLYRNGLRSDAFLRELDKLHVARSGTFGMFPLPLVSHSPSFPFSAMSPAAERRLIAIWRTLQALSFGKSTSSPDPEHDPWTCKESWGLAYLVWAVK